MTRVVIDFFPQGRLESCPLKILKSACESCGVTDERVLVVSDSDELLLQARDLNFYSCHVRQPNDRHPSFTTNYTVETVEEVEEVINAINGVSFNTVFKSRTTDFGGV